MELGIIKLLFDTGLFILIWIVQLVIYPSFIHYSEDNLQAWHNIYTQRVSIIVLPLMLGQLFSYAYSLSFNHSLQNLLIFGLIIFNWAITFVLAVPLHNKISKSNDTIQFRKSLINVNWPRTVAWSIIFFISLISYYAK